MTNKDMQIIRNLLKGCSKEEIIVIFEGVLTNLHKQMEELGEVLEKVYKESVENAEKCETLVEYTRTLESIISSLIDMEIEDTADYDTECDECLFNDICNGADYPCGDADNDRVQLGRKPKGVHVWHPETGYTGIFSSLQEASEELKVSIGGLSEVANGKRNAIKGYRATFL